MKVGSYKNFRFPLTTSGSGDIPEKPFLFLHKTQRNDSSVFCDKAHVQPHNRSPHLETTSKDS